MPQILLNGLLILLGCWPGVGHSATVVGLHTSLGRVVLKLTPKERGLLESGDQFVAHPKGSYGGFSGFMHRRRGRDQIVVEVPYPQKLPGMKEQFVLEPTYVNKRIDAGVGWRGDDGANRFGERFVGALEAGSGMTYRVAQFGPRLTYFWSQNVAMTGHYTRGTLASELAVGQASQGGLRLLGFVGDSFHTILGYGIRSQEVELRAIDPLLLQEHPEKNTLTEQYGEFGVGNLFSFATTRLGQVFVLGVDWFVVQSGVPGTADQYIPDELLEREFPMTSPYHIYSRVSGGFSF